MEAILAGGLRLALSRRALRVADDERLVAEVRAGNRSAFEALYDRHHAGILAFSRHMLGSREESEDVVQHTFAAAYQAMLADERELALKAWLYAIARNRCLSVLRARREHVALDDADASVPATAGLSVEVEQREDLRALLADLQRLPDDQRAALILAELGAHSHEEIAHILGVPTPKIKALVFQARDALMSRRLARDADCGAIREQLAVLRGGARRRGELRHHVAQCEGCRAFDAEVLRQRAGMAVLLPVVPALALKESSLIAAFAAGGSGAAAAGGGAAAAGGGAVGATAAGTAVAGGTVAGGTVAGGTVTGGTVAGATAASGAAVVGGATGIGSSAALTTGGAVLGAKVIGAKALTALAVTGAAGGGYAAVHESPSDPPPPPRTQVSSIQREQPQRPGPKTPLGTVIVPIDEQCRKQPAASPGGCPKKPAVDPRPTGRAPADRFPGRENGDVDGDGVANRDDKCRKRAGTGTVDGCPAPPATSDPAAANPTPADEALADSDGDGVPNAQDGCRRVFGTVNGCPKPSGAPPTIGTPTRGDLDGDGIPNAQDDDRDGDGVLNTADVCPDKRGVKPGDGCPATGTIPPTTTTPAPRDLDGDGIPNRKDTDLDGDGIPNKDDPDIDDDRVANAVDACPRKSGPGTDDGCPPSATGQMGDRDDDGIPNALDDDRDGDLFPNKLDPCPNKPAPLPGDGCTMPARSDPTTTVTTPAGP